MDRGPGRILKLLLAAVAVNMLAADLPSATRFPLVFLAVLLVDNLRSRDSSDVPLYLEDIVGAVLLYASVGFLCWGFDHILSKYTSRHAGPVMPAILLAVLDRALLTSKRR